MVLGITGIIVSLVLLITLAYRGMPVIIAAPIASVVALLFSGAPILASYTEIFMPALAGYVGSFFPVFLLGAIFGVLMTVTGFAESIARTVSDAIGVRGAMAATVITSALMTYGGISLFVVAFVMFPLARELFRVADIPKRLIPATIALGIFTFTMTALPGTPQIQNIIPGQFFGTTGFAAPGIGILGSVLIFSLGMIWLEHRRRQLMRAGEHFGSDEIAPRGRKGRAGRNGSSADGATGSTGGVGGGSTSRGGAPAHPSTAPGSAAHGRVETLDSALRTEDEAPAPQLSSEESSRAKMTPSNRVLPFVPLLTVFAVNFALTLVIFPAMEWGYLSQEQYGEIALADRASIWAVVVGLAAAVILLLLLHVKQFAAMREGVVDGVKGSMLPIFSTASEVGYGAVVASVAAFAVIRDAVFNVGGDALVTSVMSTSITAAITGSSSGGMTIALNAFGEDLRMLAEDQGISLEAMHRLTAMASGGLDTLPHSGAVVTLLLVCGMTHRQSYKDLGVVTLVIPVIVVVALLALVSSVGAF